MAAAAGLPKSITLHLLYPASRGPDAGGPRVLGPDRERQRSADVRSDAEASRGCGRLAERSTVTPPGFHV